MSETVEQFLAKLDSEIREIATALREKIKAELPDAVEQTHGGWKVIGYSIDGRMKTTMCAILPHTKHVNLQFFHGADLERELPDAPLEGTGKQARHLKLRSPEDAWSPELTTLLLRAHQLAEAAA